MKQRLAFVLLCMLIAAGALFAGGGQGAAQPSASGPLSGEIRFSWWGNEARNNATMEAIRFYESKHPGTKINVEPGTIDGYYNKLMAQVAAKTAPDIFTLSPEWLPPVVEAGGAADLTGLIDVSTHNVQVANACSVGGKMYGVNVSLNANVVYYNKTLADELGIKMPSGDYTWDDLVKICAEVYQKTGGKTYGMGDLRMLNAMETHLPAWCMTHLGKEPPFPWTDSNMIITGADVAAFMDYWNKAPRGVVLPPDEAATVVSQVSVPSSVRRTFLEFAFSGTFTMYQSQTKDVLEMIEWPNNHKGKGNAVSARPGLVECVANASKNKALAIDFLAWFANDADAGRILKGVRGVLPSTAQREAVLADPSLLSDNDKKIFAIVDKVYAKPINPYSAGPTGVVYTLFGDSYMKAVGAEVAFGRITPQEAGKRFEEMMKEVMTF